MHSHLGAIVAARKKKKRSIQTYKIQNLEYAIKNYITEKKSSTQEKLEIIGMSDKIKIYEIELKPEHYVKILDTIFENFLDKDRKIKNYVISGYKHGTQSAFYMPVISTAYLLQKYPSSLSRYVQVIRSSSAMVINLKLSNYEIFKMMVLSLLFNKEFPEYINYLEECYKKDSVVSENTIGHISGTNQEQVLDKFQLIVPKDLSGLNDLIKSELCCDMSVKTLFDILINSHYDQNS